MSSYAWFHLSVVLVPLIFSVLPKWRSFWSSWRQLLAVVIFVSIPWIMLDMISFSIGWWSYNQSHVWDLRFVGLPIEEILFFLTVPFSILFLWYSFVLRWGDKKSLSKDSKKIYTVLFLAVIFLAISSGLIFGWPRTVFDGILLLLSSVMVFKSGLVLTRAFWYWLLAVVILFLIFNGILTGLPIVIYSKEFMSGFRIGSIPVEDLIYNLAFVQFCLLAYWLTTRFSTIFRFKTLMRPNRVQ